MPLIIIPLLIVLALIIFSIVAYFSAAIIFRFIRALNGNWKFASIPNSITRPLQDSRNYAGKIKRMAQQHPPGPMQDRLRRLTQPVDEWLSNLQRLEQALTRLYSHRDINRELRRVTYEIEQLRRQILTSPGNEVDALRDLLKSKKKHCAVLEELSIFRNQTELRVRKIASDLGAAYAEMMLISTRGDFNDKRLQRLDENLQENLSGLRDILVAMDDLGYSSSAATSY